MNEQTESVGRGPAPESPDTDVPDSQLLHRYAVGGAADAFTLLVHRHGRVVHHVCRMILGNPADADDAFQATFLVLVRRAGSVRRADALGSWLCGVATRVSLRAKGRRGRLLTREVGAIAVSGATGDPLDRFPAPDAEATTDADEWRVVTEELGQLPEKYRAPLVLCYLEGRTTEDAARRLGWSVGTFKSRLLKARELLRGRLTRRGLALTAVALAALLATTSATAAPLTQMETASQLAASRGASASAPVSLLAASTLRSMRSPFGILWRTCPGAAAALALAGAVVMAYSGGPAPLSPRGAEPSRVVTPLPAGNANQPAVGRTLPQPPPPRPADAAASAPPSGGLFLFHSPTTRKT